MTVKIPDSLPWCLDDYEVILDKYGHIVAECILSTDAAYIVHACNAYPALVKALKPFASIEPTDVRNGDYDGDLALTKEQFLRARAALKAAGVEP